MNHPPRDLLPELPSTIRGWKALLEQTGVRPSKGKGQNFLFERGVVQRIVRTAGIVPGSRVIEIGPGLGILTRELLANGATVTAIELDWRLAAHLRTYFANIPEFRLVEGDALAVDLGNVIPEHSYHLVANLPYSIATAIIQRFLEAEPAPDLMVVMIQKEVALRLIAQPPEMSILAVATQFFSQPQIAFAVPPGVFLPPPNVDSAVVTLRAITPPLPRPDWSRFFGIVHAGFGQKRKNLANSLSHGLGLQKAAAESWLRTSDIDPTRRAETLSIAEWVALARIASGLNE